MARPLLSLIALAAATFVAAGPSAVGAHDTRLRPGHVQARVAIAGETIVIGPDGADMREVARGADGLFYVHAIVNGERVRFLVDTGANYTVLTSADAERIGLSAANRRYDARVETAAGQTSMAWATLDRVEVAGRALTGLRAAIVRDGLGVSLLGQNMLSRLDMVTIEGDRLRMR